MFRSASHRQSGILGGIIAFSIAGLVMFRVHGARIGDAIAVETHAEEMAPLVAITELVNTRASKSPWKGLVMDSL